MLCSASLTQCSSCDRGFTGPTNQQSLQGAWLRLSPRLWLPVATVLIHIITGGMRRCIQLHAKRGGEVRRKKKSQRERRQGGVFIHPSIHMSGEDERKFRVQIHLPSKRAIGGSTYCILHIHALCGAEASTLASRYILVHMLISYIHIDGWRLGRQAIRSINLGLLCPASEQVAHLQQPPPQRQSMNLIGIQNIWQARVCKF